MKIFFGKRFLDGIKPLYDENKRQQLKDEALLADFDAMVMASSYLKKTGVVLEVSGREERACERFWNNYLDAMLNGGRATERFYSMQGAKEKLYVQAILLNAINERILRLESDLVRANTKKGKEDKKAQSQARKDLKSENGKMVEDDEKAVYKRNRDEAVALWGILSAKVLKNYYDYQMAVNNRNDEPNKEIVVNGKNLSDIVKKLYHGKFTKIYPISNYPNRDKIFERELPKLMAESRRELMTPIHGIYDRMTREIIFGKIEDYSIEGSDPASFNTFIPEDQVEKGANKFAKRLGAGMLAASMIFNSVGYPLSQILGGENKGEIEAVTPQVPNDNHQPQDEKNEDIIITNNPNEVSPNPAEDNEKAQENIGDKGTITPEVEPDLPENEENIEKNPEFDMPNDQIPNENTSNNNKGEDTSEDFWVMN